MLNYIIYFVSLHNLLLNHNLTLVKLGISVIIMPLISQVREIN